MLTIAKKAYNKAYYKSHIRNILKRKADLYVKNSVEIRKRMKISNRKRNLEVKRSVMKLYGGCCKACGTSELAILSIDHVNDDGCADRKSKKCSSGATFYWKLLSEPLRNDLQVLCQSCQWRKRIYGPDIATWGSKAEYLQLPNDSNDHYSVVYDNC